MPMLTAEDIKRAQEIHGEPAGSVHAKMTKKKVSRAVYNDQLVMDERKQVLHTDVMHLDGQHCMIMVCEPLQLILQCAVERETASVLGNALQNQIKLLRSKGFNPVRVHTDPQSVLRLLTTKFKNVAVDT